MWLVYLRGGRPLQWYVKRGLRVGARPKLQYPFSLDPSHCWLIDIGDDVEFAPDVAVVAHDASTHGQLGFSRIARVRIGDRVFVGHGALILPGVSIGDDSVIGAGSVVASDVAPGSVAVGNPARVISTVDEYLERQRQLMETRPVYGREWTDRGGVGAEGKESMRDELREISGFVDNEVDRSDPRVNR
jgi:maltose O-acetyltransferase